MTIEQNKAISRRFLEAFDRGDMPAMEALVSPRCVAYQGSMPEANFDAFKQQGQMFLAAFSDSRNVVEDQIAEGDRVLTRATWSATHTGNFMGIPPTGRHFSIATMSVDRIQNGQIVEHRAQPDLLAMLQQLGIIPAPQQG